MDYFHYILIFFILMITNINRFLRHFKITKPLFFLSVGYVDSFFYVFFFAFLLQLLRQCKLAVSEVESFQKTVCFQHLMKQQMLPNAALRVVATTTTLKK